MWVTGSHVPYDKILIKLLKDISFVTDGVQCHLLVKNCIRVPLLARKTIDFNCSLSH